MRPSSTVASAGSAPSAVEFGETQDRRRSMHRVLERARTVVFGRGTHAHTQRAAATAFLIRVANAAVAFFSQVLLARWMGSHEFGIYVYVWTWVVLLGGVIDFGLGTTAQRLVAEYSQSKSPSLLRGFLFGSRWATVLLAGAIAALMALAVKLAEGWLASYLVVPFYVACIALPLYGLNIVQDGIARAYNCVMLALLPMYIVRPLMILGLLLLAYMAGAPVDAATAMIVAAIATWVTSLAQFAVLDRRLRAETGPGDKRYDFGNWIAISFPIFLVSSFYYILNFIDVLVLQAFRPPSEVGVYFATTKIIALVAFIYFSVGVAVAHKFAELNTQGDRKAMTAFLNDSVRWTFWPSLAATAALLVLGRPLLSLFGPDYVDGYPVLAILAIGHLARAAVGPGERLLNMLGEQKICAIVYAGTCAFHLTACVVLIPRFGMAGAAMATTLALLIESVTLFLVTKWRLGFHIFIGAGATSASRQD